LVQGGVYDEFSSRFAQAVGELQVGSGLTEGVTQGPLIDMAAVEKVEEHIQDALAKGARLVVGGERHSLGGQFFRPTVLAGATTEMKVDRNGE
jgi:succinate-semialdehyde dehydrogenase/glutarate-semialdehyde dehydrogenase